MALLKYFGRAQGGLALTAQVRDKQAKYFQAVTETVKQSDNTYDAVIVGAGAAGLMAAETAAHGGARTLLVDHNDAPGAKILISGGGRCNFTNIGASHERYLSENPAFARSALARYTPADFMEKMRAAGLTWHEKTLGQLFCDQKSSAVVDMLVSACKAAGVAFSFSDGVREVMPPALESDLFTIKLASGLKLKTRALVIASGGLSIPKLRATGFAYEVAKQFGLPMAPTRAGLVPLTFHTEDQALAALLAGVSHRVDVSLAKPAPAEPATGGKGVKKGRAKGPATPHFEENLLFTHRGLSGPAILQISSYWAPGDRLEVNLVPDAQAAQLIEAARASTPKQTVAKFLAQHLPQRLAATLSQQLTQQSGVDGPLGGLSGAGMQAIARSLEAWSFIPSGTEGYKKAEVTCGGVSTAALQQATMMCKTVPGLYFIGECVDVTGWLGGYNFQWAWASGFAAGKAIAEGVQQA